jgi:hypothetical protein
VLNVVDRPRCGQRSLAALALIRHFRGTVKARLSGSRTCQQEPDTGGQQDFHGTAS